MKYISLFCLFVLCNYAFAQELNCIVNINATQVTGDKQVFPTLQDAIRRYMNNTKWTNDVFAPEEKIECFIDISVQNRDQDRMTCMANIRVLRPSYNSTYKSVIANISDKNVNFNYVPNQELYFTDGTYNDNLTAILNFYGFVIVGLDYDTFSAGGGQPYFQKAQEWVNLASGNKENGWTVANASNPTQTREGLARELQNGSASAYHAAMYKFHRNGMDKMESDPAKGRKAIIEALKDMETVNRNVPVSRLLRVFLDAKSNELVAIFGKAFPTEKQSFLEQMQKIDPTSMAVYNKVLENK